MSAEATVVELHGPLGDMFGREHKFYISSPGEAIRALCSQFKGFRETMSRPGACYSLLVGGQPIPLDAVRMESGNQPIHIVPAIEGAGGKNAGLTQVLVGAGLIAASIWLPGVVPVLAKGATLGWVTEAAYVVGMQMALNGAIMLIAPAPRSPKSDRPENTPSSLFSGAVNTISQNHPIQICYGEIEIGSAIIATMIDHSEGYAPGASGKYVGEHQPSGGGDGDGDRDSDRRYADSDVSLDAKERDEKEYTY